MELCEVQTVIDCYTPRSGRMEGTLMEKKTGRNCHRTAVVDNELFLWGGNVYQDSTRAGLTVLVLV